MDIETAKAWVDFISGIGLIAYLVGSVYLFVKGWVFSRLGVKSVVVETIAEVLPDMIEQSMEKLIPPIVSAVSRGIKDAHEADAQRGSL